jgi:hypothetical protein
MTSPGFFSETGQTKRPVAAPSTAHFTETPLPKGVPTSDDVKRTTWLIFVLITLLLLVLFVVFIPAERQLIDDIVWYIPTGQLIWTAGSFPRVDEFSHTFRGQPWIARDWLGYLAYYGSYSLAGWRGVAILSAASIALAYGLLFFMLARTMRLTVAISVAMVMMALSLGHLHARTQLLADSLIVIWTAGLVRAVDTKTSPSWWLLPVMVLWANVHGGFIAGLALVAGLGAEAVIEAPGGERILVAKRWTLFLLAAVCASCLTPYGWEPLLLNLQYMSGNEAMQYTQEFNPVSMKLAWVELIFVLLLMSAALLTGLKIRPARVVLVTVLTVMMLSAVRYVGPYNLVLPLLLAAPLCVQFPILRLTRQIETQPQFFILLAKVSRPALYPLYAAIVLIPLAAGTLGQAATPGPSRIPVGAVDYLINHNVGGNIYNDYEFGGYLMLRKVPTFIDGRTDQLFQNGFISRLIDAARTRPRKFAKYLDDYKVNYALVKPNTAESDELEATLGWRMVYSDKVSALFEREP